MIDLVFPLVLDASGSLASTSEPKRVWRGRVLNVLSTFEGSRVMRPRFGTRSPELAFENQGTIEGLAQSVIRGAMQNYLPEVTLQSVTVTPGPTWPADGINVHIVYETPAGRDSADVPMTAATLTQYSDGFVSFETFAIGD